MASNETGSEPYEVRLPASTDSSLDYAAITTVIADYFTNYYQSLEQLVILPKLADFIADTDDTHLYLRGLQYSIDWRKEVGSGIGAIADSKVESIEIKYAKQRGKKPIEVTAYVKVGYRYLQDESRTAAGVGDLWEIELDTVGGTLKIVSLNSESSDYQWRKNLVAKNLKKHAVATGASTDGMPATGTQGASYTKKNAIDDAYAEINAWMIASHLDNVATSAEPARPAEQAPEAEEGSTAGTASVLSVGVSYDAGKAWNYGYYKGSSLETGIFRDVYDWGDAGDCTNFVSQCIWAGYGGAQTHSILTQQYQCAVLAQQDWRQIRHDQADPWYGNSVLSNAARPALDWIRVGGLWEHVQTNSMGPRGVATTIPKRPPMTASGRERPPWL
jgi:hypothetical protein